MDCPSCRSANPEGNRFCGDCGAPLPQRCGVCGHQNPTGKRFCGGCGVPLTGGVPPEKPSTAATPDSPAAPSAERRQLTVMFCDLVGSTELAARLDPEDLREVIAAYHRCVATTVARFDGFVAKYMGDGVLIYRLDR
jgi:Double zinc ribbon/Adenylate and Guanylate cyclase catalytic domain